MDPSKAASSNVTVEYTDPSGLFPLVQPTVESKLPLKNLHWKSPTRPVRSIESLRIGFAPAQTESAERKSSSEGTGNVTHRRHQIPGLRQTPYLKVYLLRCDDNDTYKATARKTLREWIKTQSVSSSSQSTGSSQEKHDAFEWLILHVVQDGDGAEKTPAPASKWGRGTTTVLEKIKADFNGSSKTAVDRVAQLRLPKEGSTKSPEFAEQLEDLIDKMKNGILASFDLRVAQYEEDIKEKDAQRSLPGWNFCTFFILKEGLARGFENVGLFDDALVGYDELSVGLDAAIRDQLDGSTEQPGNTILNSSKNWVEVAKKALKAGASVDKTNKEEPSLAIQPDDFPLSSNKFPYREMILASDISIFDFRTYIFSRQLTLLLRAARAPSLVGNDPATREKKPEDLILLSEICQRSTEFISLAARTLRYGLDSGLTDVEANVKSDTINNIVSNWAYAAALQILDQTFTSSLSLPESSIHAVHQAKEPSNPTPPAGDNRGDVPRRSSSLIQGPGGRSPRPVTQDISEAVGLLQRRLTLDHPKSAPALPQKTGSEQLASSRGELLLLARRSLEEIAQRHGWVEKWNNLGLLFDESPGSDGMAEVSLDGTDEKVESKAETSSLVGVELPTLKAGLTSKENYLSLYEELTDHIVRHNIVANRANSSEMALADIAILRFRQGDYEAAASYFHQMAPFYGSKLWVVLEGIMLELYSRCLKELNRNEDYVRMMLKLLAQFATYSQSKLSSRQKSLSIPTSIAQQEQLSGYVADLFEGAKGLQKDVTASLADFFADLQVDPAIRLYDDKDGFQIQLSLRFLLGPEINIDSVKVRLVSASSSQHVEHWIEGSANFTIKSSTTKILIDSSTTLQGKYIVDRLEMKSGNLLFTFNSGQHSGLPIGFRETDDAEETDQRPFILCYPAPNGLHAKVVSPHLINLEAMRTLELELSSGRNDIQSGTIRVRPATAGLRLRIAETEVVDGELDLVANHDSGVIEFSRLSTQSFVRLRIPYTVEEAFTTLSARAEIGYNTPQGRFAFSTIHSVVATLPISVNVQDIFKDEMLFSRFTISPAMLIPLRITNCNLPSSDAYEVQSSITGSVALDVFPKQPASLLYKISPTGKSATTSPTGKRSLRLQVDFTCVDDECLDAVEKQLAAALESSPFTEYATLLTSHLVGSIRGQLSTADMEVIGLVREIEMLSYRSVRWDDLLGALKGRTEEVRQWLMAWHEELAGQPLECSYELHANPDLWLLGGRRRGNFLTRDGETSKFTVLLLPQKPGHLLLPGLEIRTYAPSQSQPPTSPPATTDSGMGTGPGVPGQRQAIACEVDYRNHGETVLVLPDLRKTTVSLSASGTGGTSWLVDSERRAEVY
ncbi:hypothetical protein N7533_009436 [Penicillium manginii]|uniref:uncharacterized protein n=1 Tax=Penicillium manginii TaxID=203109 RepID=UPI0025482ECA|nr:uncharacterized protein N7533_009436 [Penicillium manginii]KAJ5744566.1 hypothetical protein N7533_009436 [Penicillium manginii]